MKHNLTITYEDIKLIPLNAEDALKYAHARNAKENNECFFTHTQIDDEAQLKWFESYLQDDTAVMFSCYVGDIWIGCNCIYHITEKKYQPKEEPFSVDNYGLEKIAEHGRILVDARNCPRGKGIGTKMIKAAVTLAFNELDVERVYAEIYEDNISSIRCHEKAGFILTDRFVDDTGRNILHYEIKKEALIDKSTNV